MCRLCVKSCRQSPFSLRFHYSFLCLDLWLWNRAISRRTKPEKLRWNHSMTKLTAKMNNATNSAMRRMFQYPKYMLTAKAATVQMINVAEQNLCMERSVIMVHGSRNLSCTSARLLCDRSVSWAKPHSGRRIRCNQIPALSAWHVYGFAFAGASLPVKA
jgi:hypothetical protein